jgi:Zn-dependent protease
MDIYHKIIVWVLPVLLAITLHEVAHGWVARYLGDSTAAKLGRLSLNPIKHIDPIGTVLVPAIMILLPGNFLFGWAKPVPVDVNKLGSPKIDMAIVAVAGPLSNLVMAILWALLIKLNISDNVNPNSLEHTLVLMGLAGIIINLILMVLNLIPLPPLDGGRVVAGLLPDKLSVKYARIERYGLFIIVGLLFTGVLNAIIVTPFTMSFDLVEMIVDLPSIEMAPYWELLFPSNK